MTPLVLAIVVKSSVIMAGAWAIALLSRRASAARRHMVLSISVVALLALPVLVIVLPSLKIPVAASPVVARIAPTVEAGIAPQTFERAKPSTKEASAQPSATAPVGAARETLPWPTILFFVYLAGVLVLVLKLAVERLAVARLVRQSAGVTGREWLDLLEDCRRETGVTAPVRLLRSLDRTMPMAFGVMTPSIMIPSIADTWSESRRRAVLLHELAHIARRDCLTQLVTRIACALYWPHPGSWLIARRLRIERELACDDRVLAIGTAAPDYAQHLLELAYSLGGYRAPALVVSMARPKQLEGRMLAVLDHARNRTTPAARSRMAALAVAAFIVVPLAAAELIARPAATTYISQDGVAVPEPAPSAAPAAAPDQNTRAREARQVREIQFPGTWEIRKSEDGKTVYMRLSERRNSMSGFNVPPDQLQGLSAAALSGSAASVKFSLRREAGTLTFEGAFRSGVGAGTFDFTPSQTFAAEMARRGYERPNETEMYVLARNDIGTAYLDELAKQKYARPTLDELLRAGDHGVDLDYLHDMGGAGYHLGELGHLIRTRDHGVDLDFVDGLKAHGLTGLTADELVRARDHGVDPEYIDGMKKTGHDIRDLEGLVHARDHGVDPEFVAEMRHHGYRLELKELVRARDHGVDEEFVAGFVALGYRNLTIEELVRMRDHGVTPAWAKRQNNGRTRLSVEELVRRRDRGGDR